MKYKKTIFTFLMLCGLFILSKPVSAAKIPVIRAGRSTNLKGTIINVKYSGTAVTMANSSAAPSIKIGSDIYVPCKTLFSDNGIGHILAISGVKTLKLDIPLVPETRINWAFVPLHIAIIYILKLCLDEEIIPRCRFPCSRGYLTKCINWQKKQSFSVSQSYRKS